MKPATKHKLVSWALMLSGGVVFSAANAARKCGYTEIFSVLVICWFYLVASLIVHISNDYES